jgi:hypothetical protein
LPIQLHHKYEEIKPWQYLTFVTKEVPKLKGSQLSVKLKPKMAITSFFSAVMSLYLGSPKVTHKISCSRRKWQILPGKALSKYTRKFL